jgi:tRNA(fMet)-specific endonuclease VapC
MNYLLDTNHWAYIQRAHPAVLAKLQSLPSDSIISMPVIAQAELLAGVELAAAPARRAELRALYENTVAQAAAILPVSSEVAEQFAKILARLRRSGRPIETNDIWVAAVAVAHDLIVVSSDAHFGYIEGLRVEDWTKYTTSSST